MTAELILAISGLILSAYFSGSEIAVISANPLQLQKWHAEKKAFAQRALQMYERRQHYLTVILIGNTLTNVLTTTFASIIFTRYGLFNWWQATLLISATILVFGEVIPKSLIRVRPNAYLLISSALIGVLGYLLHPPARLFDSMTRALMRLFRSTQTPMNIIIRREEIEQSIYKSYEDGVLNEAKQKYIDNVFDFSDTNAGEIITPRTDIVALPEDATFEQLKETFISCGYSKIIIYRENIDFIIGYVSLRDIFGSKKEIREMLRPIKFYPETKSIIELLKEFQRAGTSIAVIVDEFGGTAGIVTMEDIVEEIFGEFDDEYDVDAAEVRRQPNGDLLISGRVEIDFLNDEYHLNLPEGEYETIAGYILDAADRFPRNGEVIHIRNHEFTILKSTPKRIELVKCRQIAPGK
jgi:putative hemolysin